MSRLVFPAVLRGTSIFLDAVRANWVAWAVVAAVAAAGLAYAAPAQWVPAATPQACHGLGKGTRIASATVLWSHYVPAGSFATAEGQSLADLPPFCRVVALAAPSPQSHIVIEAWLPEQSRWNGKLLGTGNGTFGGKIVYPALAGGLRRGYAVANTDMGTHPAAVPAPPIGIAYAAGNGRPEAVKDWGYRATHEMAVLGKELVRRFYQRGPQRSYFIGCSTGGHQGLTEAQRFPGDFDGIIAGAPGHNRTHLHTMFMWLALTYRMPQFEVPTPRSVTLWNDALRDSCLRSGGGAPGDTFLTDPARCPTKPRQLQCRPGNGAASCIPEREVRSIERILSGVRNARTGALIYPPVAFLRSYGGGGGPKDTLPVTAELSHWVFGPQWDPASFDLDRDMARIDEALAGTINANGPDLTRFVGRGGKLILFHGWEDTIVSPYDTLLYHDRAFAKGARKQDFLRLFMVPGMDHCAGGPGLDQFGQSADLALGPTGSDLLVALERWVEKGVAPQTVLARKLSGDVAQPVAERNIVAARPICAYPSVARYDGKGPAADAASFVCRKAPPLKYEWPAPEYLR